MHDEEIKGVHVQDEQGENEQSSCHAFGNIRRHDMNPENQSKSFTTVVF
jgi:hypothetical protein